MNRRRVAPRKMVRQKMDSFTTRVPRVLLELPSALIVG
jgi:hypothetical protein